MKNKNIKFFWSNQAQKYAYNKNLGSLNLEMDSDLQLQKKQIELKKINAFLPSETKKNVLDLGCGVGYWSFILANKFDKVLGVDFEEKMIDLANERLINSSVKNLSFKCSEASSFKSSDEFDLVFISGLLIYLDDDSIKQLLTNIDSYTNGKSVLLLRDGTGIKSTHVLDNVYSEALKSKYSAIYRTSEQYKSLFSSIGFEIISETDMFDEGSPLNKWKETRLRLYLFGNKNEA